MALDGEDLEKLAKTLDGLHADILLHIDAPAQDHGHGVVVELVHVLFRLAPPLEDLVFQDLAESPEVRQVAEALLGES